MDRIKFGTDGWRAVIAKDYTIDNVSKVAQATALWLTRKFKNPVAVVGYDCRFGGEMFMDAAVKILASKGIRVFVSERYITTPMLSLGILKLKAHCGIIITASHSPAEFNGYKLRGEHGGPLFEKDLKDVENLISNEVEIDLELISWNMLLDQGMISYIDLEAIYVKALHDNFNLEALASSDLHLAFDAMYGSSQNLFRKLLPNMELFHCEINPSFRGIPPEPIQKNLFELTEYIWKNRNVDCGLAVDGDGDRIAVIDRNAVFYDANQILLLLIHYLVRYRNMTGKVVVSFSTTSKIEKLCQAYGLEVIRARVGFKDISRIMMEEQVLIAGEESGGISFGSHIPERDAIWAGMMLLEWLAETKRPLHELYDEVLQVTGPFFYDRANLDVSRQGRNRCLELLAGGRIMNFGPFKASRYEVFDGVKFFFGNDWLMIRASGTEPLLRLYAESENPGTARELIQEGLRTLSGPAEPILPLH